MEKQLKLPPCWEKLLKFEFQKSYMIELNCFLKKQFELKKTVYPQIPDIFSAFHATQFNQVKVVILGQDPYHGPNQAHGLAFSVKKEVKFPPSLINIFKELQSDQNLMIPTHGNLQSWTQQGVLLLNSVLTVEAGIPTSHQNKGWEIFTDKVIEVLNEQKDHLVFLLWGTAAQKKGSSIDPKKHLILSAPHPSPLSAHRGFLGCRHFSKTNSYLVQHKIPPINWRIE
jgi:uracil-DNA glycosylase